MIVHLSNVCSSEEHVSMAQFHIKIVVSNMIYVSYGILLLHMGMYALICAPCLYGKKLPSDWNWFVSTLCLSLVLFLQLVGVCIYGKWSKASVGSSVIWWRHTLSGFYIFCVISQHRLWLMG